MRSVRWLRWFVFALALDVGLPALGYIPSSTTIFSRVASNHGKGIYKILLETHFEEEGVELVAYEEWFVEDGDTLAVTIRGGKGLEDLFQRIIYKGGKRYRINPKGEVSRDSYAAGWIEALFHFRGIDGLTNQLVKLNILASSYQKHEKARLHNNAFSYIHEPGLTLTRHGGGVSYQIRRSQDGGGPLLLIEQDQFHIRKVQLSADEIWLAENYTQFSNGFWFPKLRTVHWKQRQVRILTQTVHSLSGSKAIQSKWDPESLKGEKESETSNSFVREFYLRYR